MNEEALPARRLANIAFHEIMHAKLDVGARVIGNLHTQGGGGLATPPTNEWTPLTVANIKLMSKHLFKKVRRTPVEWELERGRCDRRRPMGRAGLLPGDG
jgi:hypothetical protein